MTDPASRGRHRKPKSGQVAVRRALTVAATAPVAGAILLGQQSAIAAENPATGRTPTTAPVADAIPLDQQSTTTDNSADNPAASPTFTTADEPGTADQRIAENLNSRVQDTRLGSTFSGIVIDATSGQVVWDHDASTALMPASNVKLATATAALTILGPNHRFTTKAVYSHGIVTLVGGGDRVLSTADLASMAKSVVAKLKRMGLHTVRVRVDDSLFPPPTLATGWNQGYYNDTIAPVRALVVNEHAVTDTSIDAGQVFARQLTAQGLTVTGQVTRSQAHAADVPLAVHYSPMLSAIVHQMLKTSDAGIAETLLRMTALGAGRHATFKDGTAVVQQVLEHYGISLENFQLYDGSGLSRSDRISAETLSQLLEVDSSSRYRMTLQPVIDGMPIAGEAGSTLSTAMDRFDTPQSKCAVGKVMAKTGTLTGAIALSGLTKGADGRWKIFSFTENGSTAAPSDIKHAMDGLAATVNGCWA
ncbi:MAG: D-alanyl-D-alanine carboxypeptidase/D-alanyl-D-alanine-endopeptidase [Streptomycetaceae bacterium]|nr:D-alanyl-D-alanine carboxypeptidase/D-alanyl-D-alanine-endopeptidase [Streptomycetaceae bacterium]